jgi:hypothetical protein
MLNLTAQTETSTSMFPARVLLKRNLAPDRPAQVRGHLTIPGVVGCWTAPSAICCPIGPGCAWLLHRLGLGGNATTSRRAMHA